MDNLEVGKNSFNITKYYDLKELYANSFGILNEEKMKPQKVILSFNHPHGQYIKNYPLHTSQVVVEENDNHIIFQLYIRITYDFVMEVLSFGKQVIVLKPYTLVKEVCDRLTAALKNYNINQNI